MTIALDPNAGNGTEGFWTAGTTMAASGSVTRTNAQDLMLVFITTADNAGVTTSSISSTQGFTYTLRKRFQYNDGTNFFTMETWSAPCGSNTSAEKPTANLSASPSIGGSIYAWAISGYNIAAPFDPNVSLPATATASTGIPGVSISTSNANDMVWGFGMQFNLSLNSVGTGYTIQDNRAFNSMSSFTEQKVVSSTISSTTQSFGTSETVIWGVIWDALQAGAAAPILQMDDTTSLVPILFRKTEVVGY